MLELNKFSPVVILRVGSASVSTAVVSTNKRWSVLAARFFCGQHTGMWRVPKESAYLT